MTLVGTFYGDQVFDIITFCSGDGSGSMCPCGNAAAAGEGCMNGTGQGGKLEYGGTASISDTSPRTTSCTTAQWAPSISSPSCGLCGFL